MSLNFNIILFSILYFRSKLNQPCALVQIPIGKEKELEGVIDVVKRKAIYFDGENGYII